MRAIDLRSDTVTLPTDAMREAMRRAEVGDDGHQEDPTIKRLEEMSAGLLGMESGLFVASGTMGNIVCALTHCGRGDEAIVGDLSHIYLFECGGLSALGGIHPRSIPTQGDGTLDPADIERAIRPESLQQPRSRLLCVENTHNRCSGAVLSPQMTEPMTRVAKRRGIAIHLDGARIFNAAVSLNIPVRELTRNVDSVTFCLSKGLGAPAGSVVCGTRDFIRTARHVRQMLGGGMRQVGVLGAAGIIALDQMVDRLCEDHENARLLADGIAGIPGLALATHKVQSNIVIFRVTSEAISPSELSSRVAADGIRIHFQGGRQFRAVTHHGVMRADIELTLAALKKALCSE
jgi:threonine aldolase